MRRYNNSDEMRLSCAVEMQYYPAPATKSN